MTDQPAAGGNAVPQTEPEGMRLVSIVGPNHSGSTLLGAMLGAAPVWNTHPHVGESHAFFTPSHERFGKPICGGGEHECPKWTMLNKNAPDPFRQMFRKYNTNLIVDSSKLMEWFNRVPEGDVQQTFVLIWRCPDALRHSYLKRMEPFAAEIRYADDMAQVRHFVNRNWGKFVSISLEALTRDPAGSLEKLCELVDIPYFAGKEAFWNFENHHFGGATMVTKVLTDRLPREIQQQNAKGDMYDDMAAWIARAARESIS